MSSETALAMKCPCGSVQGDFSVDGWWTCRKCGDEWPVDQEEHTVQCKCPQSAGLNAALNQLATDSHRRSALWFPLPHSHPDRLLAHLAMGLAGSTEKACDAVEKMLKDNTDAGLTQRDIGADYTKIGQDLTDALIYTAMLAQTIGLDWELSIDHMIVKCEGRSVAP